MSRGQLNDTRRKDSISPLNGVRGSGWNIGANPQELVDLNCLKAEMDLGMWKEEMAAHQDGDSWLCLMLGGTSV